ncbi:MAG: hypothetical protein NG712_04480 [Omnitrophica bacterium]|nr:hypothetical protein [Candidatus Omnitrophota bacterium]
MFLGLFKRKPRLVTVKRKAKAKKTAIKKKVRPLKAVKVRPKIVGKITHYFPHVKAGVILVTNGTIALGDTLRFKGHTTEFKQKVNSLQINNVAIKQAKPGQEIGLLVKSRVRHNDLVYKV